MVKNILIFMFRLLFESIFYIFLLFSVILGIMYSVKVLHDNGSVVSAQTYCHNFAKLMKIKKIISVNGSSAELQMEDDSIYNYTVRRNFRGSKGGGSIQHISIKENDYICMQ